MSKSDIRLGTKFISNKKYIVPDKEYRMNLPKNTVEILKENMFCVDNLYLKHHRFSYTDIRLNEGIEKDVVSVLKYFNGINANDNDMKANQELLDKLHKRTEKLVKLYPLNTVKVYYTPMGKLMIGVGGESPYGNLQLMSLHPLYGVPYIPASAIKGTLRYYWENHYKPNEKAITEQLFGRENESENSDVQDMSGSQGAAGALVFFDTFPYRFELGFDVQTPHFSDYYQSNGETPPTDDQSPIPLVFPYMKAHCDLNKCRNKEMFCFYIAFREKDAYDNYSAFVREAIESMLQNYGIGAKTAYGYGLAKNNKLICLNKFL